MIYKMIANRLHLTLCLLCLLKGLISGSQAGLLGTHTNSILDSCWVCTNSYEEILFQTNYFA